MNPWMVNKLEDFLFFCCPECDTKEKDRKTFLDHAFDKHPDTKTYLSQFLTEIPVKTEEFLIAEPDISFSDHEEEAKVDLSDFLVGFDDNIKTEDISVKDEYSAEEEYSDYEYYPVKKKPKKVKSEPRAGKSYECHGCQKIFTSKVEHMKHSCENSSHQCSDCLKSFKSLFTLYYHKRKCRGMVGEDDLKCSKCAKVFKARSGLIAHDVTCNGPDKEKTFFICGTCGKNFTTKQGM